MTHDDLTREEYKRRLEQRDELLERVIKDGRVALDCCNDMRAVLRPDEFAALYDLSSAIKEAREMIDAEKDAEKAIR